MTCKAQWIAKQMQIAILFIAVYAVIMPSTAKNGDQQSIENPRTQIRQAKAEIESNYKEKEAACLKKFVANPCIDEAKLQKKNALALIKQREMVLNDEERASKKTKLESKQLQATTTNTPPQTKTNLPSHVTSPQAEVKSNEQANASQKNASQIQRQQEKQTQKQSQTHAQAKLRAHKAEQKKIEAAKKAAKRANKSAQDSVNAAKYQSKVAAAYKRKSAVEEKNASRNKAKAAPLPSVSTSPAASKSLP